MIGTRDGAKIGTLCVKYGNAKVCPATSFLSIEMFRVFLMMNAAYDCSLHSIHRKERRLSKD